MCYDLQYCGANRIPLRDQQDRFFEAKPSITTISIGQNKKGTLSCDKDAVDHFVPLPVRATAVFSYVLSYRTVPLHLF